MTLTEFLLARIADDEKRWTNPAFVRLTGPWLSDLVLKMRAECDAKRNVIALADYWRDDANDYGQLDQALRLMAVVYADHTDYDRDEWKP